MCVRHTSVQRTFASPDQREPLTCTACDLPDVPPGIRLLGITGAPGVGKSTVAAALGLPVVPMDGFHYADVELVRRGLRDRKGAPETFDAEGYAALLRRVRAGEPDVVAPMFERDLEQPIAGAIAVPATGTVVTEGNYLLLDEPRWRAVRARARRGLAPAPSTRSYGASGWSRGTSSSARRRTRRGPGWRGSTTPNAALVEAAGDRADLVIDAREAPPRTPPA